MRGARRLVARVRDRLSRSRLERDLQQEIEHHLDLLTDEFVRRGHDRDDARRAARLAFGGIDQTVEAVRDRRSLPLVDALVRDVRAAIRALGRTPAFTATAVTTLALGIGVNIGIFTITDAVLFRPLPYPEPDRLVALWETRVRTPAGTGEPAGQGAPSRTAVAPANLADYQARAVDLAAFALYMPEGRNAIGDGSPERLNGEAVSDTYFDVLGVAPAVGRSFREEELQPGSDGVVVLGHGVWRRQFAEDPAVLGRSIELDGRPHEIVGVMPAGFEGASHTEAPVDFWIPAALPADMLKGRGEHVARAVGRLRPGATVEALRARLADVPAGFAAEDSRAAGLGVDVGSLRADETTEARPLFLVLVSVVAIILITAAVNVTGLMVVRSIARGREAAVRAALGASRARLVMAYGVESALLSAAGTAAGLLLGYWTTTALVAAAPASIPHLDDVTFGSRTLAFALALGSATTVVVGLLPAWFASGAHPSGVLQSSGRAVIGGWLPRSRPVLLAGEIALSLLLLVGAVLMTRSLVALISVDLGFDPHDVLATRVALARERYDDPARRLAFFEAVESRLETVPGVRAVTFANRLPLRGNWSSGFELQLTDGTDVDAAAGFQAVSPGYLETLRIPLERGRWFDRSDRASAPQVAVVNLAFSRELTGGRDPIGMRFRRSDAAPWVTIVGVVGDIRRGGRTAGVEPQVYVPAAQTGQYPLWLLDVAVRTDGEAAAVEAAVRDAIWSVDARQPVTLVRTLDDTLALGQAEREFQTSLILLFAALALLLAVVGTYGVVTHAVSESTAEIGLRVALGASAPRVLVWVARHATWPTAIGAAGGLAGAWFLSRYLEHLLFAIPPTDWMSYAAAATVVVLVATGASLAAGRKAVRIDPANVLK